VEVLGAAFGHHFDQRARVLAYVRAVIGRGNAEFRDGIQCRVPQLQGASLAVRDSSARHEKLEPEDVLAIESQVVDLFRGNDVGECSTLGFDFRHVSDNLDFLGHLPNL